MIETKPYFKNLDWLRAYAAIGVVIYHFGLSLHGYKILQYWWIWVYLFFVISGFLITNILINIKNNPAYFRIFYFRRAIRILPLYFLCLIFVLLYGYFSWLHVNGVYTYILFIQNWIIWVNNGIIEFPAMFGHSWTLAIEQQFYLFWPLLVRYLSSRNLLIISIILIVISVLSRFYLFNNFWWFMSSYSTLSHMDTLLWGWVLAMMYNKEGIFKKALRYNFLIVCFSALLYFFIVYTLNIKSFLSRSITSNDYEWPFMMLIVSPLCIFSIHFLLVNKIRVIQIIFSNPLICYLWKISYGIYLYHLIINSILTPELPIWKVIEYNFTLFYLYAINPFIEDLGKVTDYSFIMSRLTLYFWLLLLDIFIAHISYKYYERRFLLFKEL